MLAYALSTILIVVITGLMFGIFQPNIPQASTLTVGAGQLMVACHQTAVSYAIAVPTAGSAASFPLSPDSTLQAQNIPSDCQRPNALGLTMYITPLTVVPPLSRMVTSWIPPNGTFAGKSLAEVEREVLQSMHGDPSVGVAVQVGANKLLQPAIITASASSGVQAMPYNYTLTPGAEALPVNVPSGAFVIQTIVTP
jgi:hypothetical protein